jgi:hypothetical protein
MLRSVTEGRLAWGLHELSAATGLSLGLLRKQVREGALRATRVGRRRIVALDDWHAFLVLQAKTCPAKRVTKEG